MTGGVLVPAHPALKALIPDYKGGELFSYLDAARSMGEFDPERMAWGKAKLAELGVTRLDAMGSKRCCPFT